MLEVQGASAGIQLDNISGIKSRFLQKKVARDHMSPAFAGSLQLLLCKTDEDRPRLSMKNEDLNCEDIIFGGCGISDLSS